MIIGSIFALTSVFIGSVSQILLKTSANKEHSSFLNKFLNFTVILAYGMMFCSSICSMISLRYLELNLMPVFQATSFFWILLLSKVILKETVQSKNIIGICIIFIGIIVYLV